MRLDGRENDQIRSSTIEFGSLKSDLIAGSAQCAFGNTIVLVIAHQLQLRSNGTSVQVDVSLPPVQTKTTATAASSSMYGGGGYEQQEYLKERLAVDLSALANRMVVHELIPYTLVRLSVQVLHVDGSVCASHSFHQPFLPYYYNS